PIEESLAAFRNVRKLRQRPAHALDDDVFDQRYFVEQRALMIEAYRGLRNLRLLFSNHPATRALEIPGWLKKPDIWTR
ncbi:MAG: AAA family ATPase, partial [Acidimicrobiia bacterium]|nr:AAA family ATPase [Acidimicrobiia bacterium]